MYEFACPACDHKVKLPFVRIGAMVACGGCGHRFQIQPEHVRRLVTAPADTGLDSDNPLLLGLPPDRPPPPQRPPQRSRSRGGGGLDVDDSDIEPADMLEAPKPKVSLRPIVPVLKHEGAGEDVARVIAMHRAERSRGRRIAWIAAIGTVLAAAVVAALVIKMGPEDPDGGGPKRPAHVDPVIVSAVELQYDGWKQEPNTPAPEAQQSDAVLVGGSFRPGPPGSKKKMYLADVRVDSNDLIEQATLELYLVDDSDQVFARTEVPMMLLSASEAESGQRHPVTVPTPRWMANRHERVVSHVRLDEGAVMEGGVILDRVVCTPEVRGNVTRLAISASNPLDVAMVRAVFSIRAFNRETEIVGRWRVDWRYGIRPGQRLEFIAAIESKNTPTIDDWEVTGAAKP